MQKQNDLAELHVNGRCEQGRRNKKQDGLDDVGAEGPVRAFGARFVTRGVANALDCNTNAVYWSAVVQCVYGQWTA
jgi:hypothetical protein